QRWSNGCITGFTNPDDGVTKKKLAIVMHKPCKKGEAAPDKNAEDHDVFAGKAVAHPADDRRGKHISKEESAGKQADLGIAHQKFFFHVGLHRKEHIAVNVIQDIQSGEHRQQKSRIKFWRHGCTDYTRQKNLLLRFWPGPSRFNRRSNPAAGTEHALYCRPLWLAGAHNVFQN